MTTFKNTINSESYYNIASMPNTFAIIDMINEGWPNSDISEKYQISIGDIQCIEMWSENEGLD